ncbi:hypothetical protein BC830DRAFT_435708 [Chytriomyces sp. MP71]|nr:hypothetical protein BC830DRAFT_435708 [Chytriomyces sp. MP71]
MSPIRGFGWLGGPLVATKGRQSARPTPTESSNEAKITPTMSPPSVSPLIRLLSPPPGYTELTAPPRMMSPKQHDFRASPYLHARSVQALMHSAMLTHSLQNECSMMTAGSELECGADGDVEKECVFRSSQGFLLWRKLRMGDCRAVTICFASIVCLSVVVGVLVFWKVFLPVMIEKSFSGGNLLSSQDPLMGITLFSISAFTSSGFNVSIALRKTGFTVPLNTPVTISAGSTCQFDAAWQDPTITSEPTWTPLLRVLPLVSEIRAANGVLSFNATRTDMEVLNGTAAGHLVSALAGTAGGKTARNESAGPWIRVTVAGDVTVGIFACPGMVLVNVVDLGSVMGDKVSGGNAGIVDVAGPEPLFANVTAEMARVGANSSVTSGVDIDLVFRNASRIRWR